MRKSRLGLTLVEVLVATVLLGAAITILVYAMTTARENNWRQRCRNNLNQIAKGMAMYIEYGDNRFYPWPVGRAGCGTVTPDFGGAEGLAALYWTKTIPDPGCFLCPSSRDDNGGGRDLGTQGCVGPGFRPGPDAKLRPDAVSYAGMGATSVAVYERVRLGKSPLSKSAVRDDFPPGEVWTCDDTEGPVHHGRSLWLGGGMNVLFFDNHVEFWPDTKVDLQRGVGMAGTPLFYLRN